MSLREETDNLLGPEVFDHLAGEDQINLPFINGAKIAKRLLMPLHARREFVRRRRPRRRQCVARA